MWNFKKIIKKSEGCYVLLLCVLCPSSLACVRKINFKIHGEPRLGPLDF